MAGKTVKEIIIKVTDKGSLKVTTREVEKLNAAVNKTNAASGSAAKGAKNLDRNMKGAAKMSSNASKNFSKQAQGMQGVLVPAYAEVAARVFALTAAYTALERAADYSILLKGQRAYAVQTGKDMGLIAKKIQEVSGYMLDFGEASKSAALATTAGLNTSAIERMTKVARGASVALGRGMADSMDRLTRGIVKAEPEILDEIGIIIRLDTVYKKYAVTLNKTTAQLSENEKLQARLNAILGQGETKFKDIAKAIDANPFGKLSATVIDLVSAGGSLITDFFGGFIRVLSESKVLLIAIMALIGKNLLTKVFPAFKNFGSGMDNMGAKISATTDKLVKLRKDMAESLSAKKIKGAVQSKELIKGLKDAGFAGGKAFRAGMKNATSDMAALMSKQVRDSIKLALAAGRSSAGRAPDGRSTSPATRGMDIASINSLDAMLGQVTKSINGIGKATKGSATAELLGVFDKVGKDAAAVADQLGKAGEAMAGFLGKMGKGIAAIGKGLGAVVGIMGTLMMVKWIGQMALELSKSVTKAHEALDALNTNLARTSETLGKKFSKGELNILGTNILKSIENSEFKSNISESLHDSITTALAKIDMELIGATFWGRMIDQVYDLFGAGMSDKLEESITSSLVSYAQTLGYEKFGEVRENFRAGLTHLFSDNKATNIAISSAKITGLAYIGSLSATFFAASASMMALGAAALNPWLAATGLVVGAIGVVTSAVGMLNESTKIFKTVTTGSAEMADEVIGSLNAVAAGTLSPSLAIEKLEEAFSHMDFSREDLLDFYQKTGEAVQVMAEATATATANIKELSSSFTKLGKAREAFARSMVKGGSLKDFADSFESVIKNLDKGQTKAQKYQVLVSENFTSSSLDKKVTEDVTKEEAERSKLLQQKANLLKNFYLIGDRDENKKKLKNLEAALVASSQKIVKIQGKGYDSLLKKYGSTAKGMIEGLVGGNITSLYEGEILKAEKLAKNQLKLTELARYETSAIREKAALNVKNLMIEKSLLQARQKILEVDTLEHKAAQSQIDNLTIKIGQAGRTAVATGKQIADITGAIYLNSSLFKDMADEGVSEGIFSNFKTDKINKDWNAFNNSLNETFQEQQQIAKALDDIKNKFGEITSKGLTNNFRNIFRDAFPDETEFKMTQKWLLLAKTSKGKSITKRMSTLNQESDNIALESVNLVLNKEILEYRIEIAEIEKEYADDRYKEVREELALRTTQLEQEKAFLDLKKLELEERTSSFKSFFDDLSSSFNDTLSGFISDKLMGKKTDTDWKAVLSQTMADSAGNIISGVATKMVFGNKGAIAQLLGLGLSQETIDSIFPKTQLEEARTRHKESLKVLSDIAANTAASLLVKETAAGAPITTQVSRTASYISTVKSDLEELNNNINKLNDKGIDTEGMSTKKVVVLIDQIVKRNMTRGEAFVETEKKKGGFLGKLFDKRAKEFKNRKDGEIEKDVSKGETGADNLNKYLKALNWKIGTKTNIADMFPKAISKGYILEGFNSTAEGMKKLHKAIDTYTASLSANSNANLNPSKYYNANSKYTYMDSASSTYQGRRSPVNAFNANAVGEGIGIEYTNSKMGIGSVSHEGAHDTVAGLKLKDLFNVSGPELRSILDFGTANSKSDTMGTIAMAGDKGYGDQSMAREVYVRIMQAMAEADAGSNIKAFVHNFDELYKVMTPKMRGMLGLESGDAMPNVFQEFLESIDRLTVEIYNNISKYQSWNGMGAFGGMGGGTGGPRGDFRLIGGGAKNLNKNRKEVSPWDKATQQFGPASNQAYGSMQRSLQVQKIRLQQLELKALQKRIDKIENNLSKPDWHDATRGGSKDDIDRYKKLIDDQNQVKRVNRINGEPGTVERWAKGNMMSQSGGTIKGQVYDLVTKNIKGLGQLGLAVWGLYESITFINSKLEEIRATDMYKEQDAEYQKYQNYTTGTISNDISKGTSTAPIKVTDPVATQAAFDIKGDLKATLASNLHSQIMNDNLNAKSLVQATLSQVATNAMSEGVSSFISWLFADGGIAPGGFKAFAAGGVVKKPTLGLVGEGKYNEAIVPLPDGKSIPVIGSTGSTENNVTINVAVDKNGQAQASTESAGMSDAAANQLGYLISQAVQTELVEQQRPGGLLS